MRARAILIALGVLALLGGLLWLDERSERATLQEEESAARIFTAEQTGEEAVTGVDLIRGDEVVSLHREDRGWRLTAPLEARAGREAVRSLLSALSSIRISDRLPQPAEDPGQYGLEPPVLQVVLHTRSGDRPARLLVGRASPVGRAWYARKEGEAGILTITSPAGRILETRAADLRERRLAAVDPWRIISIELSTGPERVVVRKGEDGWRVESPVQGPAGEAGIAKVLAGVAELEADGYAPADATPVELGLGDPSHSLSIGLEDGEDLMVRFAPAEERGEYWGMREDVGEILRIPARQVESLVEGAREIGAPSSPATAGQEPGRGGDS